MKLAAAQTNVPSSIAQAIGSFKLPGEKQTGLLIGSPPDAALIASARIVPEYW